MTSTPRLLTNSPSLTPRVRTTSRRNTRPTLRSSLNILRAPHFFLVIPIVLWLNSGMAEGVLGSAPGVYKWGTAMVWVGLSLLSLTNAGQLLRHTWALAAFCVYVLLTLGRSDPAGSAYVQNLAYLVVASCIYSFYSAPGNHLQRRLIGTVALIDMAIVGIRTWLALNTNPDISRYLATGGAYEDITAVTSGLWGVGGYAYAYALPPVLLIFLHRGLKRAAYWRSSLIIVAIGSALLVKMAFTIAVIMWIVAAATLIAAELFGRRHRGAILILAMSSIVFLFLFGPGLLTSVARSGILPGVVSVRLEEVSSLLAGEHTSNTDLGSRFQQYGDSWRELSNSWLVGSAGAGRGMGESGAHSTWLDTLATFGVWGLLLALFLVQAYRRQRDLATPTSLLTLRVSWIYFTVLGIVNTLLFAHIILIWMVIVPFLLQAEGTMEGESKLGAGS